jgi:hypothetical protein
MHLTGMNLIDMHLAGIHLIGVHLIGVHLSGVHLTGVHLLQAYNSYRHESLAGVHLIRGRRTYTPINKPVGPLGCLSGMRCGDVVALNGSGTQKRSTKYTRRVFLLKFIGSLRQTSSALLPNRV